MIQSARKTFQLSSVKWYHSVSSKSDQLERPKEDRLYSKLELEIKSHDPAVLKSYSHFVDLAAKYLEIEVGNR